MIAEYDVATDHLYTYNLEVCVAQPCLSLLFASTMSFIGQTAIECLHIVRLAFVLLCQ